jgi:hypothetical protein
MTTHTNSMWWGNYQLILALPVIILNLGAFSNDTLNASKETSYQTRLKQAELFNQFLGTWKYELSKDTSYTFECKPFNDGFEMYMKYEMSGKIIMDQKAIMNYDKKSDKFIQRIDDPRNYPYAMWFTSEKVCEAGPVQDIDNLAKSRTDRRWEFISPDLLYLFLLTDDKSVIAFKLTRVKS